MSEQAGKRGRGRPRASDDPRIAKAYACVGRTVWQLGCWGFDLRKQVFPVVARLSADILKLQNADGLPLGPDRIEQIYKAWLPQSESGWVRNGQRLPLTRPWSYISKDHLEASRPQAQGLGELAKQLLERDGHWGDHAPRYLGDPVLTAKHEKQLFENPAPALRHIPPDE